MAPFGLKQFARQCLKTPLLLNGLFSRSRRPGFYFLAYHRVCGDLPLDIDLPFSLFRRQLELLARSGRVVSYEAALRSLEAGLEPAHEAFVLTFDDGYEDFFTHVFPLLQTLNLPAILFVTSGFVETGIPYPILRHGFAGIKPVNWDMLAEMAHSNLVTIGAHTHTHPLLTGLSPDRLEEELVKPLELFQARFDQPVHHFAYPKAVWSPQVERRVAAHYRSAVIGQATKAEPGQFHPFRIPRLPIRRSDGWLFFRAKIQGWLDAEESLYESLRRL